MPVAITCPLCRAGARVPYEMLGQRVRCPACLQTILAPPADELLPVVTLAPAAEPGSDPPPVAHVLKRPAAGGPPAARLAPPDRPWTPAEDAIVIGGGGGSGLGLALALVLGTVGLILLLGGFVWFMSARSSAPPMNAWAKSSAAPVFETGVPPGWEAPGIEGEPGSPKPNGQDTIAVGPYDAAALAGPVEKVGPLTITPVVIPGLPAEGDLVESVCWSADGSQVFILTGRRQLVRADVPGFARGLQLDFTNPSRGLARSAKGLVVTLPTPGEVCVVDPATLAVIRRVGVTAVRRAVTSPDLGVAYALCWHETPAASGEAAGGVPAGMAGLGPGKPVVVRIDLETGSVVPLATPDGLLPLANPELVTVSPDGKSLTAPAGSRTVRLDIIDDSLRPDQPLPTSAPPTLTAPPAAPPAPAPAAPVVVLSADGKRTFAQDEQGRLVVRDADGKQLAAYELGPARAGQRVKQIVPHPGGKGLFVALPQELIWVELPAD